MTSVLSLFWARRTQSPHQMVQGGGTTDTRRNLRAATTSWHLVLQSLAVRV